MTRRLFSAPQWLLRLRYSLKARLITTFVLLAVLMVAVFVFGMQRGMSNSWREAARPLVLDYAQRLFEEIGTPPSIERAQAITQRLPITITISGPQVNWSNQQERTYRRKDTAGKDAAARWSAERRATAKNTKNNDNADENGDDEQSLNTRQTADGHRIELGLQTREWRERPRKIGWITLSVLLGLIALSYFLVRRALKPIDAIREGTQRIGKGQFDQPITNTSKDELGDLARDVNIMGERIASMLEAKRTLLLAMSHELRSPLTRARLNSELLPELGESAVRRTALLRDLQEMAELIDHLLESEKLAQPQNEIGGASVLLIEEIDIEQMLIQAKDKLVVREPEAAAIIIDAIDKLGTWPLDAKRMDLLLRNLLENALRHGAADRAPIISARRVATNLGEELIVSVRDFGAGVSASDITQLSQAFWRPGTSRSRASGGVGLGLYLSRLVAEAHGGKMEFKLMQPGLEVAVSIPKMRGPYAASR
jgi:signal transduction histidine kinase